jgi:hypothetical protein
VGDILAGLLRVVRILLQRMRLEVFDRGELDQEGSEMEVPQSVITRSGSGLRRKSPKPAVSRLMANAPVGDLSVSFVKEAADTLKKLNFSDTLQ